MQATCTNTLSSKLLPNTNLYRHRQKRQTSHDCQHEVHEVSTCARSGAPGRLPAAAQQTDGTAKARTRTVIHCDNYCPASPRSTLHLPDPHPTSAHGLRYDRYVSAGSECCCRRGVVRCCGCLLGEGPARSPRH